MGNWHSFITWELFLGRGIKNHINVTVNLIITKIYQYFLTPFKKSP